MEEGGGEGAGGGERARLRVCGSAARLPADSDRAPRGEAPRADEPLSGPTAAAGSVTAPVSRAGLSFRKGRRPCTPNPLPVTTSRREAPAPRTGVPDASHKACAGAAPFTPRPTPLRGSRWRKYSGAGSKGRRCRRGGSAEEGRPPDDARQEHPQTRPGSYPDVKWEDVTLAHGGVRGRARRGGGGEAPAPSRWPEPDHSRYPGVLGEGRVPSLGLRLHTARQRQARERLAPPPAGSPQAPRDLPAPSPTPSRGPR